MTEYIVTLVMPAVLEVVRAIEADNVAEAIQQAKALTPEQLKRIEGWGDSDEKLELAMHVMGDIDRVTVDDVDLSNDDPAAWLLEGDIVSGTA